jgi:hypothetical protein
VTPGPAPSLSCTVRPERITAGQRAILGWSSNADTVFLGETEVEQSGTRYVEPIQTQVYTLRAVTGSGETECSVTLEVGEEEPPVEPSPVSIRFWADDEVIQLGECTLLRWAVQNVKAVYLDDNGVVGQGEQQVCPKETQTYTLRVDTGFEEEVRRVMVEVVSEIPDVDIRRSPVEPQLTIEFWASDEAVRPGSCTSVNWSVTNAKEVYFEDQGAEGQGSIEVCPEETQTYSLRVVSDYGEEVRRVTVDVLTPFIPPLRAAP